MPSASPDCQRGGVSTFAVVDERRADRAPSLEGARCAPLRQHVCRQQPARQAEAGLALLGLMLRSPAVHYAEVLSSSLNPRQSASETHHQDGPWRRRHHEVRSIHWRPEYPVSPLYFPLYLGGRPSASARRPSRKSSVL
jgi:hypothetical protein